MLLILNPVREEFPWYVTVRTSVAVSNLRPAKKGRVFESFDWLVEIYASELKISHFLELPRDTVRLLNVTRRVLEYLHKMINIKD